MTIRQVQEAMHRQPFRPFAVRLADGRSFEVKHPDFIADAAQWSRVDHPR